MSELEVMHRSQWLAALIGVAAFVKCGNACADLLTFEDLPSLLEQDPDGGGGYLDPDYHGFRFNAANSTPYPGNPESWAYFNFPTSVQNPEYHWYLGGWLWGMESGEFCLGATPYTSGWSSFTVDRADDGLWSFDGAWFASIESVPHDLYMRGYRGSELVYLQTTEILHGARIFIAPPSDVLVDRVVFKAESIPGGMERGFTLDDFNFTLVPTPGACVLLLLSGVVMRARRRA